MAKLRGETIRKMVEAGRIVVDPFDPTRVGPNSYDLTLGRTLATYSSTILDARKENTVTYSEIRQNGVRLEPGQLYLGVTAERAGSDFYVPCIEGRSSVARLGICVHLTAGFGDLGFAGYWTLEITVVHPVWVYAGMRICQVAFDTVEGKGALYTGKYTEAEPLPVPSRLYRDFEP